MRRTGSDTLRQTEEGKEFKNAGSFNSVGACHSLLNYICYDPSPGGEDSLTELKNIVRTMDKRSVVKLL